MNHLRRLQYERPVLFWVLVAVAFWIALQVVLYVAARAAPGCPTPSAAAGCTAERRPLRPPSS